MTDSVRFLVLPRRGGDAGRVNISIVAIPISDAFPSTSHPFYDWPAAIKMIFGADGASISCSGVTRQFKWDRKDLLGRAYKDGSGSMWRDLLDAQAGVGINARRDPPRPKSVAWLSLGEHAVAHALDKARNTRSELMALGVSNFRDEDLNSALDSLRDNTDRLRAQSVPDRSMTLGAAERRSFNEVIGAALRYPALARELGLVLDGSIAPPPDDCAWLAFSEDISLYLPGVLRQGARTLVHKLDGTWRAARREDDPSGHDASPTFGRLSPLRHYHLDPRKTKTDSGTFADCVDPVGAALARGSHRPLLAEQILVFSSKVAERVRNQHLRSKEQFDAVLSGEKDPAKWPPFFADDGVRGVAIDVRRIENEFGGDSEWMSLCLRQGTYRVGTGRGTLAVPDEAFPRDEGYVQPSLMGSSEVGYVSDVAFRLDGWSLVCPHPFESDPGDTEQPVTHPEKPVVIFEGLKPPAGSLLPLRWGCDYRIRARPQDVAGNDMFLGEWSHPSVNEGVPAKFRRAAPIAAPIVSVERKEDWDTSEARRESTTHVVLLPRGSNRVRSLLPPVGSFKFAEFAGQTEKRAEWLDRSRVNPVDEDGFRVPNAKYLPDPQSVGLVVSLEPATATVGTQQRWPAPLRCYFLGSWPDLDRMTLDVGVLDPDIDHRKIELELDRVERDPTYRPDWEATVPQIPRLTQTGAKIEVRVMPGTLTKVVVRSRPSKNVRVHRDYDASWGQDPDKVALDKLDPITPAAIVHVTSAIVSPRLRPRIFGAADKKATVVARHMAETSASFEADVLVHEITTSKLEVIAASWKDRLPTPRGPEHYEYLGPVIVATSAVAALPTPTVGRAKDVSNFPRGSRAGRVRVVHDHGDTKHRVVEYRVRAHARSDDLAGVANAPHESALGVELSVPSSKPPAIVDVQRIVPILFRRRGRPVEAHEQVVETQAGLRFYLGPTWWSSGDGERLAFALPENLKDPRQLAVLSRWANDPIRPGIELGSRALSVLRPDGSPAATQKVILDDGLRAQLCLFDPQWDPTENSWYVDFAIGIDADVPMPHVRFAIGRYQPHSIEGAHLSALAHTDFVQLAPGRTATIKRKGEGLEIQFSHLPSRSTIVCGLFADADIDRLPYPPSLSDPKTCADVFREGVVANYLGEGKYEIPKWVGQPWLVVLETEKLPAAVGPSTVPVNAFQVRLEL